MIYYVNHLVKELQSIHENRLELANKLQLAMNSNPVSMYINHIAYFLHYVLMDICISTFLCYWYIPYYTIQASAHSNIYATVCVQIYYIVVISAE